MGPRDAGVGPKRYWGGPTEMLEWASMGPRDIGWAQRDAGVGQDGPQRCWGGPT